MKNIRMNWFSLPKEMAQAAKHLEDLPDDHEYTNDEMEWMEDLRHEALKIVHEVEAIFESLRGR